jgi:hypothetical protein
VEPNIGLDGRYEAVALLSYGNIIPRLEHIAPNSVSLSSNDEVNISLV